MTAFRHAVASFDPTADAVLIWTRLTGQTSAQWQVATDPELRDVVASGTATTGPHRDCTVTVDITGLAPSSTYWFAFTSDGERSPVGRTRTLPAGPTERARLAAVCCARYCVAPLTVYRAVAQTDVDLVVHLGDYIYDDEGASHRARQHRPPHPTRTLDDYRERMAQIREDSDCQAMHLQHPVVAMWDDHDFADNAWRGGAQVHDEVEDGPWSARLAAAVQARQEWLPIRQPDPDDPMRTWRSVPLGDLAEVLLLDTRIVGRDLQSGEDGAAPIDDPDRSLLGDEQRQWLASRLADTGRPWSIVGSGVVVNPMPIDMPGARLLGPLLPDGYAVHSGEVVRSDQWDGYTVERDRLIRALAVRKAAGGATVLLSGDVHSSWAFDGPCDPSGRSVAVEVTVPSISSVPMGHTRLPGMYRLLDGVAARLPHVHWADVIQRGFVVLELTPSSAVAVWQHVDAYDTGDVPETTCGHSLRTSLGETDQQWHHAPPVSLAPVQPSAVLPARPDDLDALRRHEQLRRSARLGAPLLAGAALGAGAHWRWRLRRRRRGRLSRFR